MHSNEPKESSVVSHAVLMQRWEALQQQLMHLRRQWLHAENEEQIQLQAQVQQLEQDLLLLEQQIKQPVSDATKLAWPWSVRLLLAIVMLPILVVAAIMAKYWFTERELAHFFQQQPPIALLTVSTTQPLWIAVAGVEIQLNIAWIGRLELAQLTFKTPTGTLETHAVLGGEILPLPNTNPNINEAERLYIHVQSIDYTAKTVQLQLYYATESAVTKMRHAKFISKAKRRSPALTTTPVLL